jgi:sugar/nucleoside kinase (ribokinase family)
MQKKDPKVICVGSMGKDIFFPVKGGAVIDAVENSHVEKKLCFEYGSKVHIDDRFVALGGCACNVSTGLSRLDVQASALGNVGADADGQWIIQTLKKEGAQTQKIRKFSESKTDISVILVDMHVGERTIFVNRDVGEKLVISEEDISGHEWCFVGSLYGDAIVDNMRVIHDLVVQKKIDLAYNPGKHNIVNDIEVVLDLIHHAEIVFVNKREAQDIIKNFDLDLEEADLADEKKLVEILIKHMKSDTAIVVVTHGRKGAWAGNAKDLYHANTIEKNICDATGAGDAFASAFLAAHIFGHDIDVCMQWGSANGDAVVEYYGAQEGLLTCATIEKKVYMFDVEKIK